MPKTRLDFWQAKFDANVRRDAEVHSLLEDLGWRVLIVWECELRDMRLLEVRLRDFLEIQCRST
jgi:DNA mismatch endonuclease (patch repair protein)